jgi:hypothetical protein
MRTVASGAVALSILAWIVPAEAHFMWLAADDPVNAWLGRQHDANGSFCCTSTDAFVYDGAYTINANGSVTLPLPDGSTHTIEAYKVIPYNASKPDPNPTGSAVWWHNEQGHTYCFALGPLT